MRRFSSATAPRFAAGIFGTARVEWAGSTFRERPPRAPLSLPPERPFHSPPAPLPADLSRERLRLAAEPLDHPGRPILAPHQSEDLLNSRRVLDRRGVCRDRTRTEVDADGRIGDQVPVPLGRRAGGMLHEDAARAVG